MVNLHMVSVGLQGNALTYSYICIHIHRPATNTTEDVLTKSYLYGMVFIFNATS